MPPPEETVPLIRVNERNTPHTTKHAWRHVRVQRSSETSNSLNAPAVLQQSLDEDDGESSQWATRTQKVMICVLTFLVLCWCTFLYQLWYAAYHSLFTESSTTSTDLVVIQRCAIRNLHKDLSFLEGADPITADEFIQRRDRLARALHEDGIDAFVVEPGYTFQYYANVSQSDWEPWEPEERPFLMIVQPNISEGGSVSARTSYLAPSFEEDRVRQLGIPSRFDLDIITWEEHWDPYAHLLLDAFSNKTGLTVMVDEEMRDFIVRGLASAGFKTVGLTPNVEAIRQQKSSSEISLLRAVNTGTVEAVRAMRPCLEFGLRERQVIDVLNNVLRSIPGFSLFFNIVLFESNAALPHGGKATGGLRLNSTTLVLIDVGAHYRGYSSDVTRTFLISGEPSFASHPPEDLLLKQHVFSTVLAAQTASIAHFRPGRTAAAVDLAARNTIANLSPAHEDWAALFTHRVGHSIGIKAHESPYLNKGNTKTLLRENMTFTSEPGIYLPGKFGIRTEDVLMVTPERDGEVVCLSGRRATSLWDP